MFLQITINTSEIMLVKICLELFLSSCVSPPQAVRGGIRTKVERFSITVKYLIILNLAFKNGF